MIRNLKLGILRLLSILQILRLKMHGVEIPWDCWILGTPRIKRHPGSTIRLGHRVSLFSAAFANPLGPQTKCFLHTMTSGALIEIGDDAGISSSTIVARERIQVGERTIIGADCLIVDNDFHSLNPADRYRPETDVPLVAPVKIGKNVFMGARCILLKGTMIGDASVIGAGSLVSQEVPSQGLFAGNPGKLIKILENTKQS